MASQNATRKPQVLLCEPFLFQLLDAPVIGMEFTLDVGVSQIVKQQISLCVVNRHIYAV